MYKRQDLDGFREVEISNNILDTIPENRLNNYKETIPLNSIVGFANILALEDGLSSAEREEYISTINKNSCLLYTSSV